MKLRGVALVDAVMEQRRKAGETLQGMPPKELEALTLGGKPLSPALRRWLEQDHEMFTLGEAESFTDLIREEYGDEYVEWFEPLVEMLTAPCVIFEGWGSDSRRLLYLGPTDAHGEYPVITVDTDDGPFACINGPVDVWLAQQAGFLDEEDVYGQVPEAYEDDRKEHARLSFGGFVAYADGMLGETLDPFSEDFELGDEDEDVEE